MVAVLDPRARWMRIDGDRHVALARLGEEVPTPKEPVLAFGFVPPDRVGKVEAATECTWLGDVPRLVRPLRAFGVGPLVLPGLLGGDATRSSGVREITAFEPRMTRLWERFSVDVAVAVERNAAYLAARAFERPQPHRVLVLEDGDRYAMRALCMFTAEPDEGVGTVLELLHDRSVTGLRAASHLLGRAVRAMAASGAHTLEAVSLVHSGSFPMFLRHAFVPARRGARSRVFGVQALEPELAPLVLRRERWYLSSLDLEG
jgi:hypothetical protein